MEHNEFGGVYSNELGWLNPDKREFFEGYKTAPILAHLAKREMEKRGWAWEGLKQCGKPQEYVWHFFKNDEETSKTAFNENYFIALWSAIEATGEE